MNEKLETILGQLLADAADDDRWDRDYALISANNGLLDETAIHGLFDAAGQNLTPEGIADYKRVGAGETAQCLALADAERMYEIAQRIARVKQYYELEARAAHLMAGISEQRGLVIRAADGYEIARKASKNSGDDKNYLLDTFNQARVFMMCPGLDRQAIVLLEEAVTLAQARGHEEVLTRGCNYLIHLYEKSNRPQDVDRVRAILRWAITH